VEEIMPPKITKGDQLGRLKKMVTKLDKEIERLIAKRSKELRRRSGTKR
jgi:hypothetical protein